MDKKTIRIATKEFIFGMMGVVIGLWILCGIWAAYQWRHGAMDSTGQFGDAFGVLNALFGGLGFIGVSLALFKQHTDSIEAEARRREDKKDEDAARVETDNRHREIIKAQERIARISAYTANLNYHLELSAILGGQMQFLHSLASALNDVNRTWRDLNPEKWVLAVDELMKEGVLKLDPRNFDEIQSLWNLFRSQLSVVEAFGKNTPRREEAEGQASFYFHQISECVKNQYDYASTHRHGGLFSMMEYRVRMEREIKQEAEDSSPAPGAK